jgi:hypothetical protein
MPSRKRLLFTASSSGLLDKPQTQSRQTSAPTQSLPSKTPKPAPTPIAQTVGGFSTPEGPILVTPGGTPVGSAFVPRGRPGSGRSGDDNGAAAEAARQRALELARIEAARREAVRKAEAEAKRKATAEAKRKAALAQKRLKDILDEKQRMKSREALFAGAGVVKKKKKKGITRRFIGVPERDPKTGAFIRSALITPQRLTLKAPRVVTTKPKPKPSPALKGALAKVVAEKEITPAEFFSLKAAARREGLLGKKDDTRKGVKKGILDLVNKRIQVQRDQVSRPSVQELILKQNIPSNGSKVTSTVTTTEEKPSLFARIVKGPKFLDIDRKPPRQATPAEAKRIQERADAQRRRAAKIEKFSNKVISGLRRIGVREDILNKLKKPTPGFVGSIAKDIFFLPAFSGGAVKRAQQLIRTSAIEEGIKTPKITFKSVIQPDGTTGTFALTNVANKKIITVLKTKPVGGKFSLGKGISAVKTKGGFKFISTTVGAVSTRLKGTAFRVKTIPTKKTVGKGIFRAKLKRSSIKGKLKVKRELKEADLFASINLEKQLAKREFFIKQRKLTLLKRAKIFAGKSKFKPKPSEKTALLGTIQRKGKKLIIQAGKAQFKRVKFGKATKGRFKPTIRGIAKLIPKVKQRKIVIQAGNQLRRQKLVQLKKSLQQAGANIPQSLQSTVKQVTNKVFKKELAKLKVAVKKVPRIGVITSRIRQAKPVTLQTTKTVVQAKTVPLSASKQPIKQKQPLKTKLKLKVVGRTKGKTKIALVTKPRITQKPRLRLRSRLALKTKLKEKVKPRSRTPPFATPRLKPPKSVPPPLFEFLLRQKLLKKRKKRRGRGKDDLVLVEGFTAKALKLRPVKIKPSQIRKFAKKFQTIGIRRRPVFVKAKAKPKMSKIRRKKRR